jgi:hypothetical protein
VVSSACSTKIKNTLSPCLFQGKWIPGIHFLYFPMATLEKSSQWKLNSSQQKNTLLSKESVFRLIKKGKHFPFHKSRSLSLVKNDLPLLR